MKHIIAIDDTGSPGNNSESLTLKSDRYSLTAVLFPDWRINKILTNLENKLNYWKKKYPKIKEFHFTDIINRRKEFKNLTSEDVANIFKDFTDLIKNEKLFIFHQTFTPRTLAENNLTQYLKYVNPSRKDIKYLTLDFLCVKIREEVKQLQIENLFEIIIDEGIRKVGRNIELPFLKAEMKQAAFAKTCSSEKNMLLQVADFFAFLINRHQLMMIKNTKTEFDMQILEITQEAFLNKKLSGVAAELRSKEEMNKEDYDKTILTAFEKNGNLESWKATNE